MKSEPVIDQRFDGFSEEAAEQDQDRQGRISIQLTRNLGSARKKELMEDIPK